MAINTALLEETIDKMPDSNEITYEEYLDALHVVRLYGKQVADHWAKIGKDMHSVSRFLGLAEDTVIKDLPLTRRTMNILKRMEGLDCNSDTLKDLQRISLAAIGRQRNAGPKTLYEIDELQLYTGIKLLP